MTDHELKQTVLQQAEMHLVMRFRSLLEQAEQQRSRGESATLPTYPTTDEVLALATKWWMFVTDV